MEKAYKDFLCEFFLIIKDNAINTPCIFNIIIMDMLRGGNGTDKNKDWKTS